VNCGRRCFFEVCHLQQYSTATRDTVVPISIEMMKKYPLNLNDRIIVFEMPLNSGEKPMLYRPGLHEN